MSSRQTFFLMAICVPAYKLAMLPSYLASQSGRDMWLVALCLLLVDVLVLGGIYLIKSRVGLLCFENKAFKVLAKIIAIAFAVYFLIQAIFLSTETVEYVLQSFFDGHDRLQMIIPLFVLCGYLAYKGEKSLARCAEIFIWSLAITIGISLVFNSAKLNTDLILPILDENGGEKLLKGRHVFLWFGDYLPFLFIDVRDRRKKRTQLVLFGALGIALATSALFSVFTMQWGEMTASVHNAFARLAGYNFISSDVGKADWIAILHWITASAFKLGLVLLGSGNAFKYVFKEKTRKIYIPICATLCALCVNFIVKDVQIEFRLGTKLWVVGLIMSVVIPLVLTIFALCSKKICKSKLCGDLHEGYFEVTDEDYKGDEDNEKSSD